VVLQPIINFAVNPIESKNGMPKQFKCLIILCLLAINVIGQSKFSISGYVKDGKSNEELIGANIYIKSLKTGVITNKYGFFSISVPTGQYELTCSYIGFKTQTKLIDLKSNTTINFLMDDIGLETKEIVVTEKRADENISDIKMSKEKLSIETIKKIPAIFGEVDILKTLQLIPGIQSAGEGTTGFFVRGGSSDQNLILLDEAPIYNASHFLGFFSVFNSDAIKDMEIYKGGIPAQYGGRLSSLLDIRMRDGNQKKFKVTGGLGLISSRLTLEGPIVKDKSSFMISARRTYADLFLKLSSDPAINNNSLYFYDLNAKANYTLNDKNRLFVSAYHGNDVFKFGSVFGLNWGNTTGSLRWNHIISDKIFVNTTAVYSNYDYAFSIAGGAAQSFKWTSQLKEISLKQDYTYYLNNKNEVKFGATASWHSFTPGDITPEGSSSLIKPFRTDKNYALSEALYVSDKINFNGRWAMEAGLRVSFFQNVGAGKSYIYQDGKPKTENTIIDTVFYKQGQIYNKYYGLEPRASIKYQLNDVSSLKASYNRIFQYLHLASLSTSALPTDLWIASNKYIQPQKADQVAIGYFRNFLNNLVETSVEVYYKKMYNQIDFRDGATLLLNPHLETELYAGTAKSYGVELSVKKTVGKFSGWLAYTLSKTDRTIPGINYGNTYPAKYDRRHNLVLVASYDLNPRWTFSANFTYATGNAVSFPVARYTYSSQVVPLYTDRNGYPMPAYHRMDLAATLNGKKKPNRKWESSWNFSIYNVYARQNPFSIRFAQKEKVIDSQGNTVRTGETEALMVYLFSIIPSATYNFKF